MNRFSSVSESHDRHFKEMSASKIPASLEYERRSDAISVAAWWGKHNGLWAGAAPEFSYQWGIAVC